jgi:hypothetical protein
MPWSGAACKAKVLRHEWVCSSLAARYFSLMASLIHRLGLFGKLLGLHVTIFFIVGPKSSIPDFSVCDPTLRF